MTDDTALEALKAKLDRFGFHAFFADYPDAVGVLDLHGNFVAANPAFYRLRAETPEDVEGSNWEPTVVEGDLQSTADHFAAASRGEPQRFTLTGIRPDGSHVDTSVTNIALRDEHGEIVGVLALARELDQLDRVQWTLSEAEERLQETLDSITDGLIIIARDWTVSYLNTRAEVIAGQSSAELVGRRLWDAFPDFVGTPFADAYLKAMDDRTTVVVRDLAPQFSSEIDGTSIPSRIEGTVYPTKAGIAVYLRDVTMEEFAREQLLESERRLAAQAALLDVAKDAIILRTLDHRIEFWNKAAENLYGWTAEEAVGRSIRELLYVDSTTFDDSTAVAVRDGYWNGEIEQLTKTGETIIAEGSWTLVRDANGEPESILAVNTDITERKHQAELALRAQRMESLGTLAGGIAHDLNNVLTPILMSAQLLARGELDPRRKEILTAMETGVKRGADMIRQVLSFARGVDGKRERVDVAELVGEVAAFSREALPPSISIVTETEGSLAPVVGDSTQLMQVLMNLVTNARDAMGGHGRLEIAARNETLTDTYTSITHLATPGKYVLVTVEDDGVGMPPELVDKIFEPFFTTKDVGSGTGLGLATSVSIIRSHGGYMQVYSEVGKGTKFLVHLPVTEDAEGFEPAAVPDDDDLPHGNGELVLVVDDEAAVRHITAQTLDTYGYATLQASNGAEALDIVESRHGRIDLVVTDMMMPVMDGAALAKALRRGFPSIPVIAASGLNANGGVARAEASGVSAFLAKPYSTHELVRSVHDLLTTPKEQR